MDRRTFNIAVGLGVGGSVLMAAGLCLGALVGSPYLFVAGVGAFLVAVSLKI